MASQVLIGCRLPHGLKLTHPLTKESVTVAGMHSSKIIGSTYVTTLVDADFWADWKKSYSDYQPLKTGAIFEARSEQEAKGKGGELAKEKTGFEPMPKEALGVKKADKE
jgi:hypothetical protein